MKSPFIADKKTYLKEDKKYTRTVFHPAVYFIEDKAYCYFPDKYTPSGLIEYNNEKDALRHAERLHKQYALKKE
ncbi:hypothetical protein CHH61_03935 [Shouchella clausii]|uniref:Uncharacterized protein n=1 Tax=Shouchella clausii TaxID=79880 RepID=A0A268S5S6_SHOCL|nr:hypothetical protein [Shouchella clausii]PAF27286.1 hypothetical protein CHH61_03935 [Shouchella clausii]